MEFGGVMYLTILELLMLSLHINILALPRASVTACLDLKYSGTENYVLNSVVPCAIFTSHASDCASQVSNLNHYTTLS